MLSKEQKESDWPSQVLASALQCIALGWPIFPLHTPLDGGLCSCGRDKCSSLGKHPRTPQGFKDATIDAAVVRAWFERWPGTNFGIVTGGRRGLVVVDMDPRHGGNINLLELEQANEKLSDTIEVLTGGGGSHKYYFHAGETVRSRINLVPGVDIKAADGYVVAALCLHATGRRYIYKPGRDPESFMMAEAPGWLVSLANGASRQAENRKTRGPGWVGEALRRLEPGNRNPTFASIAGRLNREGLTREDMMALLVPHAEKHAFPISELEGIVNGIIRRYPVARSTGSARPEVIYCETPGGICYRKTVEGSSVEVGLANFNARITAEVVEDDGVDSIRTFELEVRVCSAGAERLPIQLEVSAEQFSALTWVDKHLGASAYVKPGRGAREHLPIAIKILSVQPPLHRRYLHTGWREIDGQQFYLHGRGAIGSEGQRTDIEVALPRGLDAFVLPDPPEGSDLTEAILSSLGFLALASPSVSYSLYAAVWRAPLGSSLFSVHISGETGAGKTVLASLAMQHYGAGFDAAHLPAGWSSTGNALEGTAFRLKDALFPIDDFAPAGTSHDVARMQQAADRILRAQGNHTGRSRMRADTSIATAKPPRGLILSTGEDVPRGQSLRARILVLELDRNGLRWGAVKAAQSAASNGNFALAMSAYLRWLAGNGAAVRTTLPQEIIELRSRAARSDRHRRTPDMIAHLAVGLRSFLAFACEAGAISQAESDRYWDRGWAALGEAAAAQAVHQAAGEPAGRFLDLIGSALASGRVHVAAVDGGEPTHPIIWGWVTDGFNHRPQGDLVGWVEDRDLYLNPDVAFAAVQRLAKDGGEIVPVTLGTLKKRLHERGHLKSVDEGRQTLLVRKTVGGQRRAVLHLGADRVAGLSPETSDQPAQRMDTGDAGQESRTPATESGIASDQMEGTVRLSGEMLSEVEGGLGRSDAGGSSSEGEGGASPGQREDDSSQNLSTDLPNESGASHAHGSGVSEEEPPSTPCYACHGSRFWKSDHGVWCCLQCHPPANDRTQIPGDGQGGSS